MGREYTQLTVSQDRGTRYLGQVDTAQVVNNKHGILESGTVGDGFPVARGTGGLIVPFTKSTDSLIGIVRRDLSNTNKYNTNELNVYDIVDNRDVPYINFGYIVVRAESNVTERGSVYIRFGTGTTTDNVIGSYRADTDATGGVGEDEATAVLVAGAKFDESANAGDLVRVVITQLLV